MIVMTVTRIKYMPHGIFESFDSLCKLFWHLYIFFHSRETIISFFKVSIDNSVLFFLKSGFPGN